MRSNYLIIFKLLLFEIFWALFNYKLQISNYNKKINTKSLGSLGTWILYKIIYVGHHSFCYGVNRFLQYSTLMMVFPSGFDLVNILESKNKNSQLLSYLNS